MGYLKAKSLSDGVGAKKKLTYSYSTDWFLNSIYRNAIAA